MNDKRRMFIAAVAALSAVLSCTAAFFCLGPENTRDIYGELKDMGELESPGRGLSFSNFDDITGILRDGLKDRSPSITISFISKGEYKEDISILAEELMRSALIPTGEPSEGDYIRYQYGGYTLSYNHEELGNGDGGASPRYKYRLTLEPVYYTGPEEDEKTEEAVNTALKALFKSRFVSEKKRIRAVHDYLLSRTDYDYVHKNNPYYRYNATAYGALCYGKASCQGFCAAMYRLLMELGVDCRIVTGHVEWEGKTEYHSWIIARAGNVYYNIDPTWDRQLGTDEYLLRDEDFFKDHVRSGEFASESFRTLYPMAGEAQGS